MLVVGVVVVLCEVMVGCVVEYVVEGGGECVGVVVV